MHDLVAESLSIFMSIFDVIRGDGNDRVFGCGCIPVSRREWCCLQLSASPCVLVAPTDKSTGLGGRNLEMRDRGLAIDEVLVILGVEHGGLDVGSREPDDGSP